MVLGNCYFYLMFPTNYHIFRSIFRLEAQVLDRFEKENGGDLMVAALCLLEVSSRGLLEVELLNILGNENAICPTKDVAEGGGKGKMVVDGGHIRDGRGTCRLHTNQRRLLCLYNVYDCTCRQRIREEAIIQSTTGFQMGRSVPSTQTICSTIW